LIQHFVDRFRHATGKPIRTVSSEAMSILMAHDYPGNVRELENIIERAFVFSSGPAILPDALPEGLGRSPAPPSVAGSLEEAEELAVRQALEAHGGNRSRAARELGIHRSTLLRKMKRFGLS
jgi:DNA-binding NtrC family response regulator